MGGAWAGVLVVLATPLYVARLGLEGYGIVGLWLVMQVMMGILDVGMGSTVVRAFAGHRVERDGPEFRGDLLRTFEVLYWGAAALLSLLLLLLAGWIGQHWLQSRDLSPATIGEALRLMALALGAQFPASLYTNGLAGLQQHGRMNALQMAGNSLRYGGGVLILLIRPDVVSFFMVQAVIAVLQTLVTRFVLWRMVVSSPDPRPVFRPDLIRRLWRYSMGMALTAVAAVLMANADRLALSALLPTAELGKYAVAFTATGLLQLGIQPFHRAFFPRYSELIASGDAARLREVYFRSCQLMAVLIIPLGVIGWVFAPELLAAWLGRSDPTVASVFRWLLPAITASGLMWLPAAFQQAHGWTRLHASMIAGALVLGAPVMVWAIVAYGTVGATTVWVLHGVSGITLGLWLMHRRLLVGQQFEWYRTVLLPPVAITLPLVGLAWWTMPAGLGRWTSLLWVGATGIVVVGSTVGAGLLRLRAHQRMTLATVGKD